MRKKIKIAIINGVIASYREGFYDRLFMCDEIDVTVYAQSYISGSNIKSIHKKYSDSVKVLDFISFDKIGITWQRTPWREIYKNYDIVFIEGNPRVITHFILSVFLLLKGKKVVVWAMAKSFKANKIREIIRYGWYKIFSFIFVYTDSEVLYLKRKGFVSNKIVGMNNGLDQNKIDKVTASWTKELLLKWQDDNSIKGKNILLSSARFIDKNRYDLMADAMEIIVKKKHKDIIWCVIGDGYLRSDIERKIEEKSLGNNVRFLGEIYQEEKIAPWFLSADIFVHPASIGLSLMHAYGYGLPVVTHDIAEYHNPEYSAFIPGVTGESYKYNDVNSLADVICKLMDDKEKRVIMKKKVLNIVRCEYNVDVMVNRFKEMVDIVQKN